MGFELHVQFEEVRIHQYHNTSRNPINFGFIFITLGWLMRIKTIGVMFTKKHMKSKTHSIMILMITIIVSKSLQHKMAMSCQSSVAADDG
jgi:hypothetical protein